MTTLAARRQPIVIDLTETSTDGYTPTPDHGDLTALVSYCLSEGLKAECTACGGDTYPAEFTVGVRNEDDPHEGWDDKIKFLCCDNCDGEGKDGFTTTLHISYAVTEHLLDARLRAALGFPAYLRISGETRP